MLCKVFLAAALAVGAGGLSYTAAEVSAAPNGDETEVAFDAGDGDFVGDGDKGGKGGGKGDFKGKGGKKGGKGKGGKGKGGKGGPKSGKGPKGEE